MSVLSLIDHIISYIISSFIDRGGTTSPRTHIFNLTWQTNCKYKMDLNISVVDKHHFWGAFPFRYGMIQILMYSKKMLILFFIISNYYHSFEFKWCFPLVFAPMCLTYYLLEETLFWGAPNNYLST